MSAASAQLNNFILSRTAAATTEARPQRRGFMAKLLHLVQESQMRRAEREVARFIEARGGRLTDDLERQIERHFV